MSVKSNCDKCQCKECFKEYPSVEDHQDCPHTSCEECQLANDYVAVQHCSDV